ncbi:MAG: type-F conjugative transfer system secretin TraK [Nitrospira sp.]|nr:type-F conjugative transfer system secretin TraK [Nitrospira sp.]
MTRRALCWLLSLLLFPGGAGAVQSFTVRDGQTVTAVMSSRELTRVSVAGAERLERVWAPAGHLQVQPDAAQGDIFIVPAPGAPASLSFFVRDSTGGTYTIIAQQRDVPSETILLTPQRRAPRPATTRQRPGTSLDDIKRLMLAMALNRETTGFTMERHETPVPLWKETEILLTNTYTGFHFTGRVFQIRNVSAHPLTLHEQEFIRLVPNVRAVALRGFTLPSGDTTVLYVVSDTEAHP